MEMNAKIIALLFSLFILFFVIELIRRQRLTFKYGFAWILIAVLGVLFAFFEQVPAQIAGVLGFELPSNFIFFALLSIFVLLSLMLTIFLCQQNNRNDTMAQKISILEFEIKELKGIVGDRKSNALREK
jgi:hypothetical protein